MEPTDIREKRRFRLLNLIIKAFAGYNDVCSQETFWTLGIRIFGGKVLNLAEKKRKSLNIAIRRLCHCSMRRKRGELDFYNDAAVLNHIYRYISQYQAEVGAFEFPPVRKALSSGTFDPFSLGHKAVATTIRNMGFEVYLALDEFSWSKHPAEAAAPEDYDHVYR